MHWLALRAARPDWGGVRYPRAAARAPAAQRADRKRRENLISCNCIAGDRDAVSCRTDYDSQGVLPRDAVADGMRKARAYTGTGAELTPRGGAASPA
jgi:hypothetical protein